MIASPLKEATLADLDRYPWPNPPATIAEQLRHDLREPWIDSYWEKYALGASVIKPTWIQVSHKWF